MSPLDYPIFFIGLPTIPIAIGLFKNQITTKQIETLFDEEEKLLPRCEKLD